MRLKDQKEVEYTKTAIKQLVSLVINQDNVTQGWVKFIITIETALIVVFYYLIVFSMKSDVPNIRWLLNLSLLALPLIGIVTAVALTLIIVRERKWQAWYSKRAGELPAVIFPIMPEPDKAKQIIREMSVGYISRIVVGLTSVIVLFWIIILLFSFCALICGRGVPA